MNMGEPEMATYRAWLTENADASPLYPDGLPQL